MNKRLFIIGTAKSGTTSMYNYLKQHPDIFLPNVKEIHHFSNATSKQKIDFIPPKKDKIYHTKLIKDKEGYDSLFNEARQDQYLVDCSPSYFYDAYAAEKIHERFPESKIIVILREPVERAFSQFLMERRIGLESNESFLKALKDDFENERERIWGLDHLYVDHGFYFKQLQYYKTYFKEDQILCVSFKNLTDNTQDTLKLILSFLKLDTSFEFDLNKAHNKYKTHRNLLTKAIVENKNKVIMLSEYLPSGVVKLIKKGLFKESSKPEIELSAINYLKKVYYEDFQNLKKEESINEEFYSYLTSVIYGEE